MADEDLTKAVAKLQEFVERQAAEHQQALERLRQAARPPTRAELKRGAKAKMEGEREDPAEIRRRRKQRTRGGGGDE